jgi:hypothetical protein
MNVREQQLQERDVRKLSAPTNPVEFLNRYVSSNFPQTVSLPSEDQTLGFNSVNPEDNTLKLMKKVH